MDAPVTFTLELPSDHAWALAQFLKRVGYSDLRSLAVEEAEAWTMLYATERLRRALAEQGYSPR